MSTLSALSLTAHESGEIRLTAAAAMRARARQLTLARRVL